MESERLTAEDRCIGKKLAPYNPVSPQSYEIIFNLFAFHKNEIFYDLGCGNGELLIKSLLLYEHLLDLCIGVEYDKVYYDRAIENVSKTFGATDNHKKIKIIHDNVLNIDISNATVPEGMKELAPLLIDLVNNHNVRIITYVFSIPGLIPVEVQSFKKSTNFYLYKRET